MTKQEWKDQSIGKNIRRLRKRAGLTQQQTVDLMNQNEISISRSSYSQMECGSTNIRYKELISLKKVFHVDFDAFFEGFSEMLDD